jgi:hypothetical protein
VIDMGFIGALIAAFGLVLGLSTILAILSDPVWFWETFKRVFLNWRSIFFYIFTLPLGTPLVLGILYKILDWTVPADTDTPSAGSSKNP